ncbi:MAG: hypothetical protein Q7J65_04720 [Candidatus Marinimicrobia bacterium]|nr:hypothetical protein [Candidatus Neomarinimicrobiota bacterium]
MKRRISLIIITVLLFLLNTLLANSHLENQHIQFSHILTKIADIEAEISQYDSEFDKINVKINRLETQYEISWIGRRRIVKLTEEKAILNLKRLDYYQQLMNLQNTAHQISSGMFDRISQIIDSLLIEINSTNSTTDRKSGLEYLLKVIEVRNWIINTRSAYAQIDNELIPKKMNIRDYLSIAQSNRQIRNDLLNLMDDKIHELTLMIETAQEEEILQNRLEQFTLEISSIGGEIHKQMLNPVNVSKTDITATDWNYSNLTGNGRNQDFVTWVLNTQPGILSSMSSYDYLPIIKSLEPSELPNYILSLDSLRNYYFA